MPTSNLSTWSLVVAAASCLAFGCGKKSSSAGGGAASATASPTPSPTPSGPKGTPLVSALKYYNHFPFNHVYTLPVTIGGQSIESVLDTGSSNLLAIGDSGLCSGCQNEYGYSSTYAPGTSSKMLNGVSWSMNFEPIGQAQAQGYSDQVAFGGQTLNNFDFGVVTQEQGIPNIWGIAYAQLAKPEGANQTPLFDALVSAANLENQFSVRLCGAKSGSSATFGGYDSSVSSHLAQVQWTPIQSKIWYTIGVTHMGVSDAAATASSWSWTLQDGDSMIVDSGTNPLVIPETEIAPLVTVLQAVATKNAINIPTAFWPTASGAGTYATIADADIAKFPPLTIDIASAATSGQTFTLKIAPSTYFQTRDNGQRFLGIQPGPPSQYILGTVFMENFVVLHNRGALAYSADADTTAQVGFYPNTGLCN